MELVQKYERSYIFLTITCDPSWPEIKSELFSVKEAHNTADLFTRTFHAKLIELKNDVT